jgi:glutamine synthetase
MMRFEDEGRPLWYEPRTVLEAVAERFAETGLTPVAAVELEFYLIDRERGAGGAPVPPRSPVSGQPHGAGHVLSMSRLDEFGDVVDAIEAACRAQGLPVTAVSKEYGTGQFEINLRHVADPILAADHAALMRRAVVAMARARGMDATFMSKPYGEDSGSGLQINLSFADAGGNVLDPSRPDGTARMGNVIAGMQSMLAESMAVFAPNLHAYRRFAPDQFTPVTRDWGENNRSVAFRVPLTDGPGRRIEHRAAGAEANPYLVMAAVLAAAHHGLTQALEPTATASGNVGAEVDESLPLRLWSALDAMEAGALIRHYFGEAYVEAYVGAKRAEFDAFMAEILPREYEWYL